MDLRKMLLGLLSIVLYFIQGTPEPDHELGFLSQEDLSVPTGGPDSDKFESVGSFRYIEATDYCIEGTELTATGNGTGMWRLQPNQHQQNQERSQCSNQTNPDQSLQQHEFEFPNQNSFGESNNMSSKDIYESMYYWNKETELTVTNGGLMNSQANQVETYEGTLQIKRNQCGRARLTPAQQEKKRLSDSRYRQRQKTEKEELRLKLDELTKENSELTSNLNQATLDNQGLKVEIERLNKLNQLQAEVNRNKLNGLEIHAIQHLPEMVPEHAVAAGDYVTENQKDAQIGTCCNDDSPITDLLMKIDADDESKVKLSDFSGLDGERITVGKYNFPRSLQPVVKRIFDVYGDISARSKMNQSIAETIYIMFCASVKEMNDLQIEQVTEDRILKWRDAIKDALRINFKVDFAMEHLKKIAFAYIGLMKRQKLDTVATTISKLEAELTAWKEEHVKIREESKVYKDAADEFSGKPVSSGML